MLGGSRQYKVNRTGVELLKNPSQRARHWDRQRQNPSPTGKYLAAVSLESGEMKAPTCTTRQLQGAPEPCLVQRAMCLELDQGDVTRSKHLLGSLVGSSLGCLLDSHESSPLPLVEVGITLKKGEAGGTGFRKVSGGTFLQIKGPHFPKEFQPL